MALDFFANGLTAKQVVTVARRRAGNADLHLDANGNETLDAPAYIQLQLLLDHLALSWDWPFTRIICEMPITARSQPVPTSLLRISFSDPFFITEPGTGIRTPLRLCSEEEFFKILQFSPEIALVSLPQRGFLQKSTGLLFVDPFPDKAYTAEVHLQPWQVQLETVDSLPWFPWSEYLFHALALELCLDQDDSRAQSEAQLAQVLFKEIRHSISDQGERTNRLTLDPTVYRKPLRL